MEQNLQSTCELIADNAQVLRKKLRWETSPNNLAIMSAFILAANGKKADLKAYNECKKILKDNAGILSEFRGLGQAMVITKMTQAKDPEAFLQGSMTIYKKLREIHKLTASPFMVMAAITLYENGGLQQADENIDKLEALYKAEKAKHPLLIDDQDRGYLAMLVAFSMNADNISDEIERCYEAAKKLSIDKNSVHSMAQVMSLSGKSSDEKVKFAQDMVKKLKAAKTPISKSYGLSAIGSLTLLDCDEDTLVSEIAEAEAYFRKQKPFKWYNCDKRLRCVYATLAVLVSRTADKEAVLATGISSTLVMVLVEQLIMMSVIVAMNASNAARSSASSN